jgi:phosphoribosylglycinamide formyltransferase-1
VPAPQVPRLGVLISGRGSNLQALIDAIAAGRLRAHIALVIANKATAGGLERARTAGLETLVVNHRDYASRDLFDRDVASALKSRGVDLVCLAGFMRLIGRELLDAYPNAILNIHPSLLPAFPGVDAQAQALSHGVKVAGVTVHFVDEHLDGGPIIVQRAVPVHDDDTVDSLASRILEEEHHAYVEAVQLVVNGGWRIEGRRFYQSRGTSR